MVTAGRLKQEVWFTPSAVEGFGALLLMIHRKSPPQAWGFWRLLTIYYINGIIGVSLLARQHPGVVRLKGANDEFHRRRCGQTGWSSS